MRKFKTFYEFQKEYLTTGCVDKVSYVYRPPKALSGKQLDRYYQQYFKKWNKAVTKDQKKDNSQSEDSKLSAFVRKRDTGCRLLKVLPEENFKEWEDAHNGLGRILDAAHVFGKGAYPWMRYEKKNVVLLNRFSHNCLDQGKSPITGKPVTEKVRLLWWQAIVDNDQDWDYLLALTRNKGN